MKKKIIITILVLGILFFGVSQVFGAETLILNPDSAGDLCDTGITAQNCSACPNHYTCIDEMVADDSGTWLMGSNDLVTRQDLFNLPDTTPKDTINSITLWFRGGSPVSYGYFKGLIKTQDTIYETDAKHTAGGAYETFSYVWINNPSTTDVWTWSEINDLQIGVELEGKNFPNFTQVYAEINYASPPPAFYFEIGESFISKTTAYIGQGITGLGSLLYVIIGIPLGFLVVRKVIGIMPKK